MNTEFRPTIQKSLITIIMQAHPMILYYSASHAVFILARFLRGIPPTENPSLCAKENKHEKRFRLAFLLLYF